MPRKEYVWTRETKYQLVNLRRDGLSIKQIARTMGKDPLQIQNKLTRMGITRKKITT